MSLDPGREIERYVVQGLLGEGGMAEVYRVRHGTLGTQHALKVLTIASRSVRTRLVQEGQVQATLRHPNIVAVTDVLDIDGSPGLLMEFIEGPALDTWLRSYRPTTDEALTVFAGILAGVQSAHQKGLIHRDLKPANVMMHIDSGAVVPKVADFGLAKAVESDGGGGMTKTKSGSTMGTPAYMAPEQIRDASRVDQRADVFSLGCILYELVCGERAFPGEDILTLFTNIADGRFTPPREHVPDLPERVEQAILRCLEVDPDDRIPTCKDLQILLETDTDTDTRIPMPTILPEDARGAEVARSMATLVPDEIIEADPTKNPVPAHTYFPEPPTDESFKGPVTSGQITAEFQNELTQMRRQNMMMMGGGAAVGLIVVVLALVVAGAAIFYAVTREPETVTVEVEKPVEKPDDPDTAEQAVKTAAATPEAKPTEAGAEAVAKAEPPSPTEAKPTGVRSPSTKAALETRSRIRTKPEAVPTERPAETTSAPPPPKPPIRTAPPKPKGAKLVYNSEVTLLELSSESGEVYRGTDVIPPGRYDITAYFGKGGVPAGTLTVGGPGTIRLRCIEAFLQCTREE